MGASPFAEDDSVIPQASFFSEVVPDSSLAHGAWLASALAALSSTDLLFFDPDNGFEVPSKPSGTKHSNKYLYWNDLGLAWGRGASLLIFQHFTREKREDFISRLAVRLQQEAPRAIVTRLRTNNALFLLACQPENESKAEAALELVRSRRKGRINH